MHCLNINLRSIFLTKVWVPTLLLLLFSFTLGLCFHLFLSWLRTKPRAVCWAARLLTLSTVCMSFSGSPIPSQFRGCSQSMRQSPFGVLGPSCWFLLLSGSPVPPTCRPLFCRAACPIASVGHSTCVPSSVVNSLSLPAGFQNSRAHSEPWSLEWIKL